MHAVQYARTVAGSHQSYRVECREVFGREVRRRVAKTSLCGLGGLCVLCGVYRCAKRAAVRAVKVFQLATSSSIESPPNFSISASASTIATIASPTTAAAG